MDISQTSHDLKDNPLVENGNKGKGSEKLPGFKKYIQELNEQHNKAIAKIEEIMTSKDKYEKELARLHKGLDSDEGLNDRIKLNIGGKHYDIRRRGDLLQMKDFPMSWLFKKKWELYLMKDCTGRIYFEAETEWLIPVLKYMQGETVEISLVDYFPIRSMIDRYGLESDITVRFPNFEGFSNVETLNLAKAFVKMNWTSFELKEICSIDAASVKIGTNEHDFFESLAYQENVIVIACYNDNISVLLSDRAIHLGRKGSSSHHTSSKRYHVGLKTGTFSPIDSIATNGNGSFPIRYSSGSQHWWYMFTDQPALNGKFLQSVTCYAVNISAASRGFILAPPVRGAPHQQKATTTPSESIQASSNPYDILAPLRGYDSVWNNFVASHRQWEEQIQKECEEMVFISAIVNSIWGGTLKWFSSFERYDWTARALCVLKKLPLVKSLSQFRERIQDFCAQRKSSQSLGDNLANDPIVSFNVEGERLCLLKSTITTFFKKSSLAVRISGRWTEQSEDVDEEGNLDIDFPKEIFKPLIRAIRARSYSKEVFCVIPERLKDAMDEMLNYFLIPNDQFFYLIYA